MAEASEVKLEAQVEGLAIHSQRCLTGTGGAKKHGQKNLVEILSEREHQVAEREIASKFQQ